MAIHIPAPDKDDLISAERVRQYFDTPVKTADGTDYKLDGALDNGSNALCGASTARRNALNDKAPDAIEALYLPLLSPDKHSYQGLSDVDDAFERWKKIRITLEDINSGRIGAIIPTKKSVHKAFDGAYHCFDAAPENTAAKHYRDLLTQAAQILEIPPLGQSFAQRIEANPKVLSGRINP